ncbi:MAG: CARDB domain-containing protein, partial [Candidatus Vogelbacteria bacterium]
MKKYIIGFLGFLLAVVIIMPVVARANPESDIANCFFSESQEGGSCSQLVEKFEKYGVCPNTNKGCGVSFSYSCADGSACVVPSDFNQKSFCGTNQNVDPWEECDDGDKTNGDGCSADCKIERGWKCTLGDADNLNICAKMIGRGSISGRQCTLFQTAVPGEQCLFDVPKSCIPGSGPASICQNGVAVRCGAGNLCLGGKCQPENPAKLNFINDFNPNLETIVFVPSARESIEHKSPDQFDGISNQARDRFNLVYFPFERSKWTDDLAKDFNVMVKQLTNLNGGYNKKIKFVTHSYGHTIVRVAILRANGYTKSSPTTPDSRIKDDQVASAYARSEFYSVSGPIGGSQYMWFIPRWPATKIGELTPTAPYQTWLYSENSVNKFKSEIGGYHSFDVVGDTFMGDLDNCDHPTLAQTVLGLSRWCKDYKRGKSDDHIKFGVGKNFGESLMSEGHPGFSNVEAMVMLDGLKTGWGTPDPNYCKNGLVTVTDFGFIGRDVGHSVLLFHPTVIAKILEDNKPNLWISDALPFSVAPTSIPAGGTVTLSNFKVMNDGNAPSGVFNLGLYLSNDTTISTTSDTLLQTMNLSNIPAKSFRPVAARTFTIPANTPAGSYYVGAIVDPADAVKESNENDNALKKTPLTVTATGPAVTITNPARDNQLVAPGRFYATANFSGSVKKVEMHIINNRTHGTNIVASPSSPNPTSPITFYIDVNPVTTTTTYTIRFVVTDNNNRTASAEGSIKVNAVTPPPSADIISPTITLQSPPLGVTTVNKQTRISTKVIDSSGVRSTTISAGSLQRICTTEFSPGTMYCYLDVGADLWRSGLIMEIFAVDKSLAQNSWLDRYFITTYTNTGSIQLEKQSTGNSKVIVPPVAPACHTFTTNLSIGMSGSEVTALQIALTRAGFPVTATG